jgi:hypothetical protein
MWISIIVNGLILSIAVIVVYIIALDLYVGKLNQDDIADLVMAEKKGFDACEAVALGAPNNMSAFEAKDACSPVTRNLLRARTIAFICVVFYLIIWMVQFGPGCETGLAPGFQVFGNAMDFGRPESGARPNCTIQIEIRELLKWKILSFVIC